MKTHHTLSTELNYLYFLCLPNVNYHFAKQTPSECFSEYFINGFFKSRAYHYLFSLSLESPLSLPFIAHTPLPCVIFSKRKNYVFIVFIHLQAILSVLRLFSTSNSSTNVQKNRLMKIAKHSKFNYF